MTIDRGRIEAFVFWALAVAHVIPVWSFRYIPTQDGPSHVNNAQIIRDLHNPEAGYDRFFEVKLDPLPNLTSHLLLAGLMYVVPPLIAEKLLVTGYILGFAGSFRYFLGAFGPDHRPLSWAGLLFVFNRCFWMGFYNYCLSLVLLWWILGFVIRRLGTLQAGGAFALVLLFTAAYFTHLAGFLMAAAGAILAAVLMPPRKPAVIGLIILAALPAGCLTMNYLEETGFTRSSAAMRVVYDPLARFEGNWRETEIENDLAAIENEVFAFHAGMKSSFGTIFGIYLLALTMLTIAIPPAASRSAQQNETVTNNESRPTNHEKGPLFPAVFGLLLLAAYLTVPDHLGGGDHGLPNGGFLKCRLALLPPLLWLACVREPSFRPLQISLRIGIAAVVGWNLILVNNTFRDVNSELARYTAGIEAVGRGHRILAMQSGGWRSPFANPMTHAVDYYCLETGNVNIDNYESYMPHFPVKNRKDVGRGRGADDFDVLICWQSGAGMGGGWVPIFQEGPLRIYRRPGN
jgi:hypothetical protein